MDWLFDDRTKCWSVQTTMTIGEYLKLASDAHQVRGALVGQRDALTTTTAKRIRTRMIADLKAGAVLPPLVVGVVVSAADFAQFPKEEQVIEDLVSREELQSLAIIDGMQRTTAILDAARDDKSVGQRKVRVEFWLATSVRAMIYRMLVLNTGQVPWTMSRQLSVVYAPLLREIKGNVQQIDKISTPDAPGRRVAAAQYSSDAIVEMYLAFSSRKTAVDTRESVSDEFSGSSRWRVIGAS